MSKGTIIECDCGVIVKYKDGHKENVSSKRVDLLNTFGEKGITLSRMLVLDDVSKDMSNKGLVGISLLPKNVHEFYNGFSVNLSIDERIMVMFLNIKTYDDATHFSIEDESGNDPEKYHNLRRIYPCSSKEWFDAPLETKSECRKKRRILTTMYFTVASMIDLNQECYNNCFKATQSLLNNGYRERYCLGCYKLEIKSVVRLSTCSGCEKVTYCSEQCQKFDWKWHKKECK